MNPTPEVTPASKISIVIPALNEARNLSAVLPLLPHVHEVILVDGGSHDGTIAAARTALPGIVVVSQTRTGKGNALARGFQVATGDIIVMFDADGSADPREIPRFVEALLAGAQVAKGSRFMPGGGSEDITRLRGLGNRMLTLLTNILFRRRFTDLCYGYYAFWSSLLPVLRLPAVDLPPRRDGRMHWGDGFEIETLLACRLARASVVIAEVPSMELRRIHGVSNLNALTDGIRVLRTILSEFTARVSVRRPFERVVGGRVPGSGSVSTSALSASSTIEEAA